MQPFIENRRKLINDFDFIKVEGEIGVDYLMRVQVDDEVFAKCLIQMWIIYYKLMIAWLHKSTVSIMIITSLFHRCFGV